MTGSLDTAGTPPRTAAGGAGLVVSNLHVTRGDRPVLHGVSLDVPPGEITALLGPNGAGKSTLVLAIGGVLRPTNGTIRLGDRDLTRQKPEKVRAAGVAVVPEGRRLLPNLSVADNLKVATYSLSGADATAGIASALDLFPELNKRMTSTARSLSGGEQQMVVIAQALASSPQTLVVDELSLGLAPVVVKRMMPVLERVAESGVGVLLIEQFAHVALTLAATAHVIEGGRIHYSGSAAALADDPELLKQAYLLGAQ